MLNSPLLGSIPAFEIAVKSCFSVGQKNCDRIIKGIEVAATFFLDGSKYKSNTDLMDCSFCEM